MTLLANASWDHSGDPCPHCSGNGYTNWDEYKHTGEGCEHCDATGFVIMCGECGNPLELVRPGKFQCNFCGW